MSVSSIFSRSNDAASISAKAGKSGAVSSFAFPPMGSEAPGLLHPYSMKTNMQVNMAIMFLSLRHSGFAAQLFRALKFANRLFRILCMASKYSFRLIQLICIEIVWRCNFMRIQKNQCYSCPHDIWSDSMKPPSKTTTNKSLTDADPSNVCLWSIAM